MVTHSSILTGGPWTEEPGGYSSWGPESQTQLKATFDIYIHIFSKGLGQCFCYNNFCLNGWKI